MEKKNYEKEKLPKFLTFECFFLNGIMHYFAPSHMNQRHFLMKFCVFFYSHLLLYILYETPNVDVLFTAHISLLFFLIKNSGLPEAATKIMHGREKMCYFFNTAKIHSKLLFIRT